jgi:hypothetical protein
MFTNVLKNLFTDEQKLSTLPNFPNTKKLSIENQTIIHKFLSKYPPYSDFNFISLWGYNTEEDCTISQYKNNLIINLRDYLSNELTYTFIGYSNIEETIKIIFNQLSLENKKQAIKLVPEISILRIKNSQNYIINEDRDSFDYIYSLTNLSELKGAEMHKLKNYVNRFSLLYPQVEIRELNLNKSTVHSEIFNLFDEWAKSKNNTWHELKALKRTINYEKELKHLHSLGLYDKSRLIAFMILDTGNKEYSQSHFSKALYLQYQGIYSYLNHIAAIIMAKKGFKYFNFEQDLGIEGLRRAKEQMKPIFFLKKYTIYPR